jgi:hypothetical protein
VNILKEAAIMRRLISLLPLLALLAHATSSCGLTLFSTSHGAWTSKDSWYADLPEGVSSWNWPSLDRARIHEVIESREAKAEELLQDVSIVPLSSKEAAEFIGEELPGAPGTQPYLTRAVYLNRATGGFSVSILDDQLRVHHGSLGRRAVPMKRQALVLQLEREPAEVFVTCSMAE